MLGRIRQPTTSSNRNPNSIGGSTLVLAGGATHSYDLTFLPQPNTPPNGPMGPVTAKVGDSGPLCGNPALPPAMTAP